MASGSRPYTGWKISLALEGHRSGKPVLSLYGEDPGAGGAAITPFLVSKVLRPAAPGPNLNAADNAVLIRDAHGVHEVAVEVPHE
jgi:hypothetical protein